jgi:hypothetical protein
MPVRPNTEKDLIAFTPRSGSTAPEGIEEMLMEHPVKTTDPVYKSRWQ